VSRISRYFIVLLVFVLSVVVSFAQEDTVLDAPVVISDALLDHLLDLERQTVELRGLEPSEEVIREFPNREQLMDYVYNVIGAELTPDVIAESNVMYRAMGFWDADFDLEATYLMLLSDQIAGFYDLETKIMNTVTSDGGALGDVLSVLDRIVYVHEYTHFLQDQNYDLTELQESVPDDNVDYSQAVLSLIEGDASTIMSDFTTKLLSENPLLAIGLLLTATDTAIPAGVPDIMIEELTASYTLGETFVRALIADGGWERVNQAYITPPTSMMHIYYPQKYLDGVQPIAVTLTDDASVLGDGWDLSSSSILGIFYWREYVKETIGLNTANALMAGWMGDYNHYYYHADNDQVAWSARITWEDETSRSNFYQTIGIVLGDETVESGAICGEVGEQFACIEALGERDVLYTVAPTLEQASALVELEG
jgi:hypothetical protein